MGMYTELVVTARIKNDPNTVALIKYMIGETEDEPSILPDFPLFRLDRWKYMLQCSSYYHLPATVHYFQFDEIAQYWCFHNRSDFKNYDDEITEFFVWLRTIVTEYYAEKTMLGYSRYEEDIMPTIHYTNED